MFNIKKIIKWVFIVLGLLLCLLIGFFVLTETGIIKLPKEEIPILKETKDDSYLDKYVRFEKQQHKSPGGNYLIVKYKGPKHFLDEDRDYYLGEAFIHNSDFKLTHFHLHFNLKRKTLSLYQDKHNNDKIKKVGMKNITFKET